MTKRVSAVRDFVVEQPMFVLTKTLVPLLALLTLLAPRHTEREILDAIRFVETSDQENPPDGDGGMSIGPYQIGWSYWADATQFDPDIGGEYEDCRRRDYAEQVIDAYMRRYAATAWKVRDAESIARTHNGGPRGPELESTDRYWEKVKRRLATAPR